jgi:urease accessory protein
MVGADLGVMDRDAKKMRGAKPFIFTNLKDGTGVADVVRFIEQQGMLTPSK